MTCNTSAAAVCCSSALSYAVSYRFIAIVSINHHNSCATRPRLSFAYYGSISRICISMSLLPLSTANSAGTIISVAVLHSAGTGLLKIANGIVPFSIFGPVCYGGILGRPDRLELRT